MPFHIYMTIFYRRTPRKPPPRSRRSLLLTQHLKTLQPPPESPRPPLPLQKTPQLTAWNLQMPLLRQRPSLWTAHQQGNLPNLPSPPRNRRPQQQRTPQRRPRRKHQLRNPLQHRRKVPLSQTRAGAGS